MIAPSPRVQKVFTNPIPKIVNNNATADEPIAACTHNRTKKLTPNPSTAPTNGLVYNTRSQSTKLLHIALSITYSMNPDATPAQRLTKHAPPPQFFTAALAAVSPETEALAMIDIKSGKNLKY